MSEDDAGTPEETPEETGAKHASQPVGYKKTPVEHRFVPGQSGNPKGSSQRRREAAADGRFLSNPAQSALLAEADRVVTVRENGRELQMTMRELITRRLMLDASKGRVMAMRLTSQLLDAAEAGKRKEVEENVKFIMHAKMDGEAALKRARAARTEPPLLVPHPDDIEIDPFTLNITLNGPFDKGSYEQSKHIANIRDKLLDEIVNLKSMKRKSAVQKERLALLPDMVARTEVLLPPSMKLKSK